MTRAAAGVGMYLGFITALGVSASQSRAETPEEAPALAAYETPTISKVRVDKRAGVTRVSVLFGSIPGARRYEVQISKALTFSTLEAQTTTAKSPARFLRIDPGVYFLRLRASGDGGDSAWSSVQIVDATAPKTISPTTAPKQKPPEVAATPAPKNQEPTAAPILEPKNAHPAEPPLTPMPVVANNAPSKLAVVWERPVDFAMVVEPSVIATGRAPVGTRIRVGEGEWFVVGDDGGFSLEVSLLPGRNPVLLTAANGDQVEPLRRDVFFAEPGRVAMIREKLDPLWQRLLASLALRRDLERTMTEIEARAELAEAKKDELAGLASAQKLLNADLEALSTDLDRMLRR